MSDQAEPEIRCSECTRILTKQTSRDQGMGDTCYAKVYGERPQIKTKKRYKSKLRRLF